jgi:hypothetical protein
VNFPFNPRGLVGLQIAYGSPRINRNHPLAKGLGYFRLLNDLAPQPLFSRVPQSLVPSAVSIIPGLAGNGLTSSTTSAKFSVATNSYSMVGNQISMLVYGVAYWSPTDGLSHIACDIGGTSGDTAPELMITKFSDNKWYIGLYDYPTERRIVVTATASDFASGVPFVIGFRLTLSGSFAFWLNKKKVSEITTTLASAPTLANEFAIGGAISSGANNAWARDNKSQIYWVGLWDRALTDPEFQLISAQPYCFLARNSEKSAWTYSVVGAGQADGFASVHGSPNIYGTGHADGLASVIGSSSPQGVGHADGLASAIGVSAVIPASGGAALVSI